MGWRPKKLLVLDINGLLVDTYYGGDNTVPPPRRPCDVRIGSKLVYKRANCDKFIDFCLQNFVVGVWSSARKDDVNDFVDFLFKSPKQQPAFVWHQEHCTNTGISHPQSRYKLVFLKELWKLWRKVDRDLPWAKGVYGAINTVLIDDSPYKASRNPPHTAIFLQPYKALNPEDNYLADELLPYLEGLAGTWDVQEYIESRLFCKQCGSPIDAQISNLLKLSDRLKIQGQQTLPEDNVSQVFLFT
jgi:hypothetical protein